MELTYESLEHATVTKYKQVIFHLHSWDGETYKQICIYNSQFSWSNHIEVHLVAQEIHWIDDMWRYLPSLLDCQAQDLKEPAQLLPVGKRIPKQAIW